MRPFGAIETCQLWKIFEVNTGCPGSLQYRLPRLITWSRFVLQRFESAANGKAHENNFAAASAEFLHRCNCIAKAFFDRVLHLCHKYIFRNVTWGRRKGENWQPDLLNGGRQFSPSRAFLSHAGATLPIHSTKVRRKTRRDQRTGTIRNGQAFQ